MRLTTHVKIYIYLINWLIYNNNWQLTSYRLLTPLNRIFSFPSSISFLHFFFLLDCVNRPRAHSGDACTCALQGCCNSGWNKARACGSHRLVTTLYVYLAAHIIYRDGICMLIMHISPICITLVVRTGRASSSAAVVSFAATGSPLSSFNSLP